MQTITKAQRQAIHRLYLRSSDAYRRDVTYRTFRRTVQHSFDCLMVKWCEMWIGIETDGYTHS